MRQIAPLPVNDPLRLMAELYFMNGLGQREIGALLGYTSGSQVCTQLAAWARDVPGWPQYDWGGANVHAVKAEKRTPPTPNQLARANACRVPGDDERFTHSRWRKIFAARVYDRGGITLRQMGLASGRSAVRVQQMVPHGRRLAQEEAKLMADITSLPFDRMFPVAEAVRLQATLERIIALTDTHGTNVA